MTYLRVDSSIRHDGSVSRALTAEVERTWLAADPGAEVVRRDLAAEPATAWQQAAIAYFVPAQRRDPAQREARALAARAADELLAADAVAIGAPIYNHGIPATLKSWIDLLITDPRLNPRDTPPGRALAGVPVSLLVACGGSYRPGTGREGWDHSTPYLRHLFGDQFGAEVTLVVAELTAADADVAQQSRAEALSRARTAAAA